ncbi:adenosylmethionine-8-amino-7-oxononanoate aminotransferase [Flavobacteriaceae bacterium MAR_2010_188]|nr:adenosylmethionine-8-amino-7-oxononanoate aminotransferase [Flavobacteriaceae bacterium MAR_2010_188]
MTLSQRDKKHLWHPLTQHKLHPESLPIISAKGCLLYDEAGKEYIDGIASWYTSVYGHCNDFITNRVAAQMKNLDQIVFSGFTHKPAIILSEELIKILPENQEKIFFSDNGSTTVEVAIKMALQFHFNKNEKRNVILAFENGFHGDTFGAMSVSGLSVYNGPFEDFFLEVKRIPTPDSDNIQDILKTLEKLTKENSIACFVYEPLVQGAAAMQMHKADDLEQILNFCIEKGIITIADEVMTGFGKTGKYFASQHLRINPDIMCLSKALTAGLLPMGITACSQKIYDAFLSEDVSKGFFHGHTYSANPLACTAAIAGIELLTSVEIQSNISKIIKMHQEFDSKIKNHSKIKSTRQKGIIYALDLNVETERYGNLRNKLFDYFMSQGIYLRPLGNTIYIHPPYIIEEHQLKKIYRAIEGALSIV